jgi:hypothetical protein
VAPLGHGLGTKAIGQQDNSRDEMICCLQVRGAATTAAGAALDSTSIYDNSGFEAA